MLKYTPINYKILLYTKENTFIYNLLILFIFSDIYFGPKRILEFGLHSSKSTFGREVACDYSDIFRQDPGRLFQKYAVGCTFQLKWLPGFQKGQVVKGKQKKIFLVWASGCTRKNKDSDGFGGRRSRKWTEEGKNDVFSTKLTSEMTVFCIQDR